MARVKVDFSKAKDFEALPVGSYPVSVEEAEVRQGREYPYINWKLKVATGEFAGRFLWMVSSLSPDSAWSLKASLKAFGETDEDIIGADVGEVELDPDDYLGREAIAAVIQEEYNERMVNRVTGLTSTGKGASASAGGRRQAAGIR